MLYYFIFRIIMLFFGWNFVPRISKYKWELRIIKYNFYNLCNLVNIYFYSFREI